MRRIISIYKHHPAAPRFGFRKTEWWSCQEGEGLAFWFFLGIVDVVLRWRS